MIVDLPQCSGTHSRLFGGARSPLWVKSAVLAAKPSLPVYPEQQTSWPAVGRSLKGH